MRLNARHMSVTYTKPVLSASEDADGPEQALSELGQEAYAD